MQHPLTLEFQIFGDTDNYGVENFLNLIVGIMQHPLTLEFQIFGDTDNYGVENFLNLIVGVGI